MQRPVMNPNFYEETPSSPRRARRRPLKALINLFWRGTKAFFRLLRYDPLARIPGFRMEEGTPTSRFIRGLLYRMAFVPVFIAATACAIVWTSTHPRNVVTEIDPASQGIYYEAVTFLGADDIRIEGWLMPVIDAHTVLQEKERVLWTRRPAVVLIHDLGQRKDSMLPLIKPLHDAGYVVLAINLRGGGPQALAGETFGVQESIDVKAAVEMLRRRPFVDSGRVALVGFGTGASAALLAAQADPQIVAVVAHQPMNDANDVVKNLIVPQNRYLSWMAPLCKWTFEMSYGVDIDELQMSNFRKVFDTRHVMMVAPTTGYADIADPKNVETIKGFLEANVPPSNALAGAK